MVDSYQETVGLIAKFTVESLQVIKTTKYTMSRVKY